MTSPNAEPMRNPDIMASSADTGEALRVDMLDAIALPAPATIQRSQLRFSQPALKNWSWPCTVLRGASDGPRLALISGVHPTEYPAIEANVRLMRQIDPATLRGTIISLPLVNVPSFLSRTPFVSPLDGKNPNRSFPGNPDGSFTEVLTHAIFQAVIAPADALLDLHGGDMVEDLVPFSIYSVSGDEATDRASADIGRAFGLPYLVAQQPRPGGLGGTTVEAAAAAGVPSLLAEAGGRGLLTESDVQVLMAGVQRVLGHLEMVSDAPPQPALVADVSDLAPLRSPTDGLWYPAVAAGDTVSAGQRLGRIDDLFGDPVAEITAPHDGVVLYVTSSPAMTAGGIMLAIGTT